MVKCLRPELYDTYKTKREEKMVKRDDGAFNLLQDFLKKKFNIAHRNHIFQVQCI